MSHYLDVKDGRPEVWSYHEQIMAPLDRVAPFSLGTVSAPSGRVEQNFRRKLSRLQSSERYGPLFVGALHDVWLNNLGNLVLNSADSGEEVIVIDSAQQTEQYLSHATPAYHHGRETLVAEEAFPILRPGDHIYGHWLIDILPRLWLLLQRFEASRLSVVVRHNIPPFAQSMLEYIGIPAEKVIYFNPNTQNLRIERAFYASSLRKADLVHPGIAQFGAWWSGRLPPVTGAGQLQDIYTGKNLYVSRADWSKPNAHRVCLNQGEIEQEINARPDWVTFHPQQYSLADQLFVFQQAKTILGEEGSGMHNSLLMRDKAHVVTLRNVYNHGVIQSGLCRARAQTEHLVFGDIARNASPDRQANFKVELSLLRRVLDQLS